MDHSYLRRLRPTRRELEVLAHVLTSGRRVAADDLGISERTVTHSLTSVYNRLGAMNRCEAAIALDWLRIPPEFAISAVICPEYSDHAERLAEAVVRYIDGVLADQMRDRGTLGGGRRSPGLLVGDAGASLTAKVA